MVKVTHGVNELSLDLADSEVADLKDQVDQLLNLSGDEETKVNGETVDDDYILEDGDEVEFVKSTGTKG